MNMTRCGLAGLAAAMLAAGAQAQMTTGTWANLAGGTWSSGANWSNGAVPTASAHIISNGAYAVTLDQNVAIGTLRLWALSPTVVVPSGFFLSVTNNGGTGGDPNNGMTFNNNSGTRVVIDGGIVTNRGYYLTGTSSIIITNGGSMVVLAGTPRIQNGAFLTLNGGTLTHNSSLDFAFGTAADTARLDLRSGTALFGAAVNIGARGMGTVSIEGATVTNMRLISVTQTPPSGTTPQTGIVSITSGSLVHRDTLLVGNTTADTLNLAQVNLTGGSYLNTSNQQVRIGNSSTGSLNVAGGTFTATNGAAFTLGNTGSTRGVGYVTNSAGTIRVGAATVQKGGWTINGGAVFADSITAALTTGVLDFQSGTLSAGAMTVGNGSMLTLGDGASSFTLSLRGNSAFSNGLSISGAAALIVSNAAVHSLSGDISGAGGLRKAGTGVMVLRGANTYAGGTTNATGVLEAASTGSLPGYDAPGTVITRNGGTLAVLAAGEAGQWTPGDIDTLLANATWDAGSGLGIDVASNSFTYGTALTGAIGFMKLGAGSLTLDGANTYSGGTAVRNGMLTLGAASQLSASADLLLGDPFSTTGAGTLDLNGGSQTISKLFTVTQTNNNSTATNSIVNLAAGQALNVVTSAATRSLHIQDGTHLRMSGAGALNVTNTAGRILIWGQRSTDNVTYRGLDLSGLGSFSANVNELVVGFDESGASQASRQALLSLAAVNTIRASNAVYVGLSAVDGGVKGRVLLGVSNRIDTTHLRIGYGKGAGTVTFQDGLTSPSLYLAGPAGTDRANLSLGEFTEMASGTQPNGSLVLTNAGSSVVANLDQLLAGSLNVSGGNAAAGGRGSMEFSDGIVDVNTVILGRAQAGTTNGMAVGSLTMNGGTLVVNTAFTLGQVNGSRPATGTFTLNGGTATLAAPLADGGGTSAVTVAGGTLDMQGNGIGSAGNPIDTLTLRSGTLRNLGEVNGGAAWAKTGAGELSIQGANAYTGGLSVDEGTLRYNGTYSGGGLITVQSGATLAGTGAVAGVTALAASFLSPGNSAGTLTVGDLTLDGGTTLNYELGTASDLIIASATALGGIEFSDFNFIPGAGFGPGTYVLINATSIGGLGAGTAGTVGAYGAELSIDGANQDLVLTVIPEPGTLGLLGLVLTAGILRRRLRA